MSSTQTYQYKALSGPRAIRVVVLQPALQLEDPLEGTIEEHLLDSEGSPSREYEALSYVWGETHGTQPMTCNDQTILITQNCDLALRHLRLPSTPRTLWIDSICIDQTSLSERATQVPLMGEIYSSATKTIIWLGPGNPTDATAFRHARTAARLYRFEHRLPLSPLRTLFRRLARPYTHSPSHLAALLPLCQNPWYARIWTLQECFLGRDPTLQSGHLQLPLSDFAEYWLFLSILQGDPFAHATRDCFARLASLIIIPTFAALAGTTSINRKKQRRVVPTNVRAEYATWWEFRKHLPYFLHQACFSNTATDPRDKVHALLPILARLMPELGEFPVRYDAPVGRVYEAFTKWLILYTRRLGVFDLHFPRERSVAGMPRWVFDFGGDTSGDLFVLVGGALCWEAAGESDVDMDLFMASPPGELHVRGARFDSVKLVSPEIPKRMQMAREIAETFVGWLALAVPEEEEFKKVRWQFLQGLASQLMVMNRFKEWGRFYVTEGGCVGISQFDIVPGDQIVVMAGGDVPAMLRAREDGKWAYWGPTVVVGTEMGKFWGEGRVVEEMDVWELV
ncbi:heterokaryon incompatibility protein-domain-containing protein [Podospora aff. communis PSN243]|uniref:Heterokaryon incompatibility protein-domain-containing protein n=1 Tax=Podospora aff. communis PSN243 TaxID=3040156 RepID=A0AAV9G7L6_9PEZI|nr:heterokaryon incompatibility protein-domain-containing protein [Podospora aff. communis PSN243]